MVRITLLLGSVLVVIGLLFYFVVGGGSTSVTALIPAFLGIPFLVLGLLGRKERFRKHAMHGAVVFALIGLMGTASGLLNVVTLLSGGDVERPNAVIAQALVAVLCIGYIVLGVRSFIEARRNR